jgi:hypothetical protein
MKPQVLSCKLRRAVGLPARPGALEHQPLIGPVGPAECAPEQPCSTATHRPARTHGGTQPYLHQLQGLQDGHWLLLLLARPEARQRRQGLACLWHLIQHLLMKTAAGLLYLHPWLYLLHGWKLLLLLLRLLLCVCYMWMCDACTCISNASLFRGGCCSILHDIGSTASMLMTGRFAKAVRPHLCMAVAYLVCAGAGSTGLHRAVRRQCCSLHRNKLLVNRSFRSSKYTSASLSRHAPSIYCVGMCWLRCTAVWHIHCCYCLLAAGTCQPLICTVTDYSEL